MRLYCCKPLPERIGRTGTSDCCIGVGGPLEGATTGSGLEKKMEALGLLGGRRGRVMGLLAAKRCVILWGCADSGVG